jgi:hypothetical protein
LTMKLELPSPLLSDSPFLSSEQFFLFFFIFECSRNLNAKSRPTFWRDFSSSVWPQIFNNGKLPLLKILLPKSGQNQNRDPPST